MKASDLPQYYNAVNILEHNLSSNPHLFTIVIQKQRLLNL